MLIPRVPRRIRSEKELAAQKKALLSGERRRRKAIKEAGIEYDFPGYAAEGADDEAPDSPPPVKAPKSAAKAKKTPGKRAAATEEAKTPAKKAKTPSKTPTKRTAKTPK